MLALTRAGAGGEPPDRYISAAPRKVEREMRLSSQQPSQSAQCQTIFRGVSINACAAPLLSENYFFKTNVCSNFSKNVVEKKQYVSMYFLTARVATTAGGSPGPSRCPCSPPSATAPPLPYQAISPTPPKVYSQWCKLRVRVPS